MVPYIIKRLLLFVPTLFLVSCVAFFLKNNVPSDPAETLLKLQGIDENKEEFEVMYAAKIVDLGLDKPYFYFGVVPNYSNWVGSYEGNVKEKQFAEDLASAKYKEADIKELLVSISKLDDLERRRMLRCQSPQEIVSKLKTSQLADASQEVVEFISDVAQKMLENKVTWHYPIIKVQGLDNQYHHWIKNLLVGDFGVSLVDARPVFGKIWDSMRWTLLILFLSLSIAIVLAFLIGVYNGTHQGSRFDTWSNSFLFLIYSIPKFWLATVMIIFFTTAEYGGWTNIFPSVGFWGSSSDGFLNMILGSLDKLVLPVLVIVIPDVAYLSRLIRAGIIEENNKEYIKTARSKGIPHSQIVRKHLIPNSLIPTITLLAGVIPGAIGTSLIIEVIFNIPGIGRLMFESIRSADWAIVFPIVFIICVVTVVVFLLADILTAWLNPKINFK